MSRSHARILAENVANLVISQAAARIAVYGLYLVLARVFSKAELGVYTLALFWGYLAASFSDLGLRMLTLREASLRGRADTEALMSGALTLRLAAGLVSGIGLWAVLRALGYPAETIRGVLIGAAMVWADYLNHNLKTIFRALERTSFDRRATIFGRLLSVALTLALLPLGALSAEMALAAGVVAFLAETLYLVDRLRADAGVRLRFLAPGQELMTLARRSSVFWLTVILAELARRSGPIALEGARGEEAAGAFGAAHRPFEAASMIPVALMAAVFPRVARIAEAASSGGASSSPSAAEGASRLNLADAGSREAAARAYGAVFFLLAALLAGPLLFGALDAPRIVALLYGEKYRDIAGAFGWFGAWLLCMSLANLTGNSLLMAGRERAMLWRYFQSTLFYFGLLAALAVAPGKTIAEAASVERAAFCVAAADGLALFLLALDAWRAGTLPQPSLKTLRRMEARAAAGYLLGSLAAAGLGAAALSVWTPGPEAFTLSAAGIWTLTGACSGRLLVGGR